MSLLRRFLSSLTPSERLDLREILGDMHRKAAEAEVTLLLDRYESVCAEISRRNAQRRHLKELQESSQRISTKLAASGLDDPVLEHLRHELVRQSHELGSKWAESRPDDLLNEKSSIRARIEELRLLSQLADRINAEMIHGNA